jgi:hypothetical protein
MLKEIAPPEGAKEPVNKPRLPQDVPDVHERGSAATKFRRPEIVEPFLVIGKPVYLELGLNGQTD